MCSHVHFFVASFADEMLVIETRGWPLVVAARVGGLSEAPF